MNNKKIELIVKRSFIRDNLNEVFVKRVSRKLKRSELKEYLKQIKTTLNKKIVKVYIPDAQEFNSPALYNTFRKIYPMKKIMIEIDPKLMLGIRIENEDNVYELSLQNTFDDLLDFVKERYDRQ